MQAWPLRSPGSAKAVNATVITLDDAPTGNKDFDKGAAKKFILDSHNSLAAAA